MTKGELIDFLTWYHSKESHQNDLTIDGIVDWYLSIYSQASHEARSVNDNKDKKEVCGYCKGTKQIEFLDPYGRVTTRKACPEC